MYNQLSMMIFFLLISIFCLTSFGSTNRIIGGEEAGPKDAPWQVKIFWIIFYEC